MNANGPESLIEAVRYFSDLDVCHDYLAKIKWPNGNPSCPRCASESVGFVRSRRMYQCRGCRKQFSVKVGTIFEDSPLGLDKWFVAVWSITNAKNGISSCELARALDVTQKSAWHMLHRVRHAMQSGSFAKFVGEAESDESYIGGASENMHVKKRKERIKSPGPAGKAIVQGILNRAAPGKSKVKAVVVPDAKRDTLTNTLHTHVEKGATVYTDTHPAYHKLGQDYVHAMIDHAKAYVEGRCHTNGLENFWSLLKRTINGTYVAVDWQHLGRYVDEQVFRFNERSTDDAGRFASVMPGVVGKRLMYKTLIGAEAGGRSSGSGGGDQSRPN